MNKQHRVYILVFCLLALLILPAISLPLNVSRYLSVNTPQKTQEPREIMYTSLPSFSYPTPAPVVNLDKTNLTGDIDLWYDSVVEIKNAYLGELGEMHYYLYNNSVLILDNVTFLSEVTLHLYDSAVLIIKNANDSLYDNDIYQHDESKLYIFNSTMEESDVKCYDNSSAYLYNSSIDYLKISENSSFVAENVTVFYTIRAYDFAQITLKNSKLLYNVYGYENATITIENTTSSKDIKFII